MIKSHPQFNRENHYQCFGIDYQSYLLLKHGFKPAIRLQISRRLIKSFQHFWRQAGLSVLIKKFNPFFYGQKISSPIFLAYLSLKPVLVRKIYEAEKAGDRKSFGKLLGYPVCCVENFINFFNRRDLDLTCRALISCRGTPSFYCHSIFNFESKLSSEEAKIFINSDKIFFESRHLFLIKHLPCSFNCPQSIKLGKITLEIIKKENPDLANEIECALKRPVLYFDYFNWLIFDGEVSGSRLSFRRILPYKSLFPKKDLEIIKKGDWLKIDKNKISVFRGKKLIKIFKKTNQYHGILLDFK